MIIPEPLPGAIADDPVQRESGATSAAHEPATASSLDVRLAGLPTRAARHLREARSALEQGRANEADRLLVRAQPSAGGHPEFLRLLGITRHLQKRREEALAALRRALELLPSDALILCNLGVALRASGDYRSSLVCLQRACDIAPKLTAAWYNLGRTLGKDARAEESNAAFEEALRCDPTHVDARIAYADSLRTLGRIDRAIEHYRLALKQPGSVRAWGRLANLKTVELDAGETAALERLYFDSALAAEDRITIGFALVKALEDQQRFEEAFAILGAVNAFKRRRMEWDAPAFQRANEAIASAFATPPKTTAAAEFGREVIFIVSLPRSGSTLVEQILASHPEVEGANELSDVWDVLDEESARRGMAFPGWVASTKPADWRRLGAQYLERTARWRKTRPRFTDKGLSNWRVIGAVQAMLPGARIVNCRRDPLETCLSCYRQLFSRGQAFSYDLYELADYWRDHDRMMRYWSARYPHRIHDEIHEELLAEPAAQIRRLLDFCGLPFNAACLRYYETPRSVRTISSAQVREPLRADTARAHRYGTLLGPLRLSLGLVSPAPVEPLNASH